MSAVGIMAAKPPFVSFETRAEEDRAGSIEAGYFKAIDVDYALITPSGSKDRVEQKVSEWFRKLEDQVRQERFPKEWLSSYKVSYDHWKQGQEVPLEGTSVKEWPILSPAQLQALLAMHLLTVESVATANEEAIARLGMGGRALRSKAEEWLKSRGDTAGKQAEQIVSLRVQLEASETARTNMEKDLKALKAQVASLTKEK